MRCKNAGFRETMDVRGGRKDFGRAVSVRLPAAYFCIYSKNK